MKRATRLTLILFLGYGFVPWRSCDAGDGTVTGDTRYKFSQSDTVPEKAKVVQTANTRQTRRVAPRRQLRSWRSAHWYYLRAEEVPWWPNAPGG